MCQSSRWRKKAKNKKKERSTAQWWTRAQLRVAGGPMPSEVSTMSISGKPVASKKEHQKWPRTQSSSGNVRADTRRIAATSRCRAGALPTVWREGRRSLQEAWTRLKIQAGSPATVSSRTNTKPKTVPSFSRAVPGGEGSLSQ